MYIGVDSGVEAKLIVKGEVTLNSNDGFGMYSFLGANTKLDIVVDNSASLNLDQNGSNGFRAIVRSGAKLNVDIKENGTFESCGNGFRDISGEVRSSATATFSGTGYTCDQAKVQFLVFGPGDENVVEPVCQACPVP
jgi:hypothetical protein